MAVKSESTISGGLACYLFELPSLEKQKEKTCPVWPASASLWASFHLEEGYQVDRTGSRPNLQGTVDDYFEEEEEDLFQCKYLSPW